MTETVWAKNKYISAVGLDRMLHGGDSACGVIERVRTKGGLWLLSNHFICQKLNAKP